MTLAVQPLGTQPIAVLAEADVSATVEPFAGLFAKPDLDLVYLVEVEYFPPQAAP